MADISKIKLPDGNTYDVKDTSKSSATNWVNGSSTGSVRTVTSAAEDSSYTIGSYAVTEGYNTKANGYSAHAEGYNSIASGDFSHVEGYSTTASNGKDHAEGYQTTASGGCAHAEGAYTVASGLDSHAEGDSTIANHLAQHVFGQYNIADTSTATAANRGNYIEIVGNGSYNARSNARTLDWSGNEVLTGKLTVGAVGVNSMDVATVGQLPTKTSDLTNDSGFITTETDPVFSASAAAGITSTDISNWNAKVSDDKTWNGVTLTKNTTYGSNLYIPSFTSTSATSAALAYVTDAPSMGRIPRYDNSAYLHSTTPSANDNSTKVATTAYVDGAIPTVPTKTSDLTNDSGFITTDNDEKLKTIINNNTNQLSHYIIFGSNSETASTKYIDTTGLTYSSKNGTPSVDGHAILGLGNSTGSGTAGNKQGILRLNSNTIYNVTLKADNLTNTRTILFPDKAGTIALTSDIPPIPLIPTDLSDLNNDLNVSDFPNDAGYITGYTETDPVFTASAAYGISTTDITNWNSKQAALVSGTNIKTINNESLLGSGNITIQSGGGSGTSVPTADTIAEFDSTAHMNSTDMTSTEVDDFVDALDAQGESLDDFLDARLNTLGGKNTGTISLYNCSGTVSHNNLEFFVSEGGEIWVQGMININSYVRSGANSGVMITLPDIVPTPTKEFWSLIGFQSQHPREYVYISLTPNSRAAYIQTSESFNNTTNGTLTFICSGRVFVK